MRTETDKLVKDLKTCACDAEELIKATAGELNDKTKEARLRFKNTLNAAKESCEALEEKALNSVKVADRKIHRRNQKREDDKGLHTMLLP